MTVTPYSYREYTGNGTNRDFQVPFPYLLKAHVKVYTGLDLATGAYTSLLVDGTNYVWTTTTNIQLTTAPAAGVKITVRRETPTGDLLAQWQDGSTLVAEDLLISDRQNLYSVQEQRDGNDASTTLAAAAVAAANAALASVASSIQYPLVANVAAIPASPADNQAVEVRDSTGIQGFAPLSGRPAGFVGDSGLSVRMIYTTAGNTWSWVQYFANDPENRYGDAIAILQSDVLGLDGSKLSVTAAAATYAPLSGLGSYLTTATAASTYAPLSSPTFTGTLAGANASFSGSASDGKGSLRSIPLNSQAAAYTLVLADAGKCISITTGGVTVPSGIFAAGDAITIFNNSTSNQSIVQGASVTIRQTGTANTGTRTLAQYGVATLLCVASNTFVISGGGLS
jgi:hypothetical protein